MNAEVRALFPGAGERIYLDVSARGLVPDPVREAIDAHVRVRQYEGGDKAALWAGVNATRADFAGLINADEDEVAVTKNVSEGLNLFGASLPWQAGDNVVVCPELEHPNNIYLWYNLKAQRGIEVRTVKADDGQLSVSRMQDAMDERTRLVTLPSISFAPGFVADVAGIATAARAAGALTLVDAAQSIGAIDTDVKALGIDALAVATQKSMMSLYGGGFLYIRREVADELVPVHVARYGIDLDGAHETAFSEGELKYKSGALRFDLGNYNYLGMAAAGAAIGLLRLWGMQAVEGHLRSLAARLAEGLLQMGLPVVGGAPGPRLAHIVSVGLSGGARHYSADDPVMNSLHDFLMEQGVHHSVRSGVLRFSVGVHNNDGDVDGALELAARWIRETGYAS
jgi:cysteine desulfurase / selenocysteine lyase